jgi:hypothetical protein
MGAGGRARARQGGWDGAAVGVPLGLHLAFYYSCSYQYWQAAPTHAQSLLGVAGRQIW